MNEVILFALVISSMIYLLIGYLSGKNNRTKSDLFPIKHSGNAHIKSTDEFASSTVATTVSLATIVLAYFELAGYFGIYLLWTAVTTAVGMYLVSKVARRIWGKLQAYEHQPSIHEFLGDKFNSASVAYVASACTSIGFLLIFATELIVGSRFLSSLIPNIPEWATVITLSAIGLVYTLLGGFRAVIKTDQLQMKFIWALIIVLFAFYLSYVSQNTLKTSLDNIPDNIFGLDWRGGLGFFLIGIAIMNIPTHITSMAVWQRIAGTNDIETVSAGFRRSIWGISLSWALLALAACFAYMVVNPADSKQLLTELLKFISGSTLGLGIIFFIVLGLYGAMLSTASTNLIVVAHTVSEDILAKIKKEKIGQDSENLIQPRIILFLSAVIAIFLVEGLKHFGFSIADLVFAIFGGSLALFPLVLYSLFGNEAILKETSRAASIAVIVGFVFGWSAAVYGKIIENSNLIFLSPTFSIVSSLLIISIGYFLKRKS